MLDIDVTEEKLLTFEVEINGVGCDELEGFVRFMHEGIEYGFPAEIASDRITSLITPLDEIFPNLKTGTVIEARLDLYNDKYIFKPWEGELEVSKPMSVTAALEGNGKRSGVSVKARVTEKKKITKQKSKAQLIQEKKNELKESLRNPTEKDIYKYMHRAGTQSKQIQDIIYEQASTNAKSSFDVLKNVVKILKKKKR